MIEGHIDIELLLKTVEDTEAVYGALKPEVKNDDRAKSSLRKEDDKIYLEITAEDTTTLRASLNSYFRLIRTSYAMLGDM